MIFVKSVIQFCVVSTMKEKILLVEGDFIYLNFICFEKEEMYTLALPVVKRINLD